MHKAGLGNVATVIAVFCVATAISTAAQTFTTVFDFDNTNGDGPNFLVEGNDGNIYGTTGLGGTRGLGTVFQFSPDGTLTTLYSFCSRKNCADGKGPFSMVQTPDGSWFGLTGGGGTNGFGTFFQLIPPSGFRVLHSFCAGTNCTDGSSPTGALTQGIDGKFYGTTAFGGTYNHGIVYSITPTGKYTVLYNFCAQANCVDGAEPYPGLIQASNGILYGTTSFGGSSQNSSPGTIFQITTAGKFTSLYSFSNNGEDAIPNGLIQGADGNLYGTSYSVGTTGTVFKFTAAGKYTSLHTFCLIGSCADGSNPGTALTQGSDGGLYGTTVLGGAGGHGTIFEITHTGGFGLLHTFCSGSGGCTDGYGADSALIQSTSGLFYGTSASVSSPYGTLYSLDMRLGPFVKATPAFGKAGLAIGILGNSLTGTSSVTFNGTPATFTVVSNTYITATVPAGATTGMIEVMTPSGTLSSNVEFRIP